MSADRFYCPEFQVGQTARIEGDEARHLAKVRRVAVGAPVEIFNGRGSSALATVAAIGRDWVELSITEPLALPPVAALTVTLAVAIPKGDRFDWLVEKATELGVDRLVPIQTERSTVDPRAAKLDRVRRAVIEASKQCRRNTLMKIDDPISWEAWVEAPAGSATQRWVAHPVGKTLSRQTRLESGSAIQVSIGPEGGFTPREIDQARASGWEPISLTTTILRIETAALAIAAHLLVIGEADRR